MGTRHNLRFFGFFLTLTVCLTLLHAYVSQAHGAPSGYGLNYPAGAFDRQGWPHWTDADHDCQDTRAEILLRDTRGPIKFKRNKPCNVSWGRWLCPYTGKEILKASELDIDHIVPLAHAHRNGGANWSREKKRQFANDPANLIAVVASANRAKGDQGPDQWRPPQRSFWPEYAKRWRAVKNKYGLGSSAGEESALREMAGSP
ncbi:MAG: HNH endonuclease [Desulfobulbaceae bacterium]|nr:HNH endonuclease [Desulfobulbaceae bacterium]